LDKARELHYLTRGTPPLESYRI